MVVYDLYLVTNTNSASSRYDSTSIFERIETVDVRLIISGRKHYSCAVGQIKLMLGQFIIYIKNAYHNTKAAQIAFSHFTICQDCHTQFKGFKEECPGCGSSIYHLQNHRIFQPRIRLDQGKTRGVKDVKSCDWIKNKLGPKMLSQWKNEPKYKLFFFSKEGCEKCPGR